jgi:hypothetical protein
MQPIYNIGKSIYIGTREALKAPDPNWGDWSFSSIGDRTISMI